MLKQKYWTLVSDTLCNVAGTNHSVNTAKTLLETALPCSLGAEGRMVINGLSAAGCSCDLSPCSLLSIPITHFGTRLAFAELFSSQISSLAW